MLTVPEDNWRAWWPAQAEAIAGDIRGRISAAVTAWRLTELEPLPGGEVALVFAAATPSGEAVLKLSPRVAGETDAMAHEGSALELWSRAGIAPHVLATRDGGLTLLLEHIRPGHDLSHAEPGRVPALPGRKSSPPPDAAEIVRTLGALCARIHLAVTPGRFRQLGEGSQALSWRRALDGSRELHTLERLLIPTRDDRLLHTDLHWLNALRGPDGWVVIDPKPYVGDPHADVFAFFAGPPLRAMPDGRREAREHVRALTELYAREAGLDRDRLEVWIRIRALAIVGEAGGTGVSQDGWRTRLLRLADALA